MINTFKTSTKLYMLVLVMSGFIIGIGILGIHEMRTMSLNTQTLNADRVLPLQQLTQIRYSYATGILATAEQLENHALKPEEAKKQIEIAQQIIDTNWQTYQKTYFTPDEDRIVKQIILLKTKADKDILVLKKKIQTEDVKLSDDIIDEKMYATINPVIYEINKLIQLQITVSNELTKKNVRLYNSSAEKIYILIFSSLLFAGLLAFYLIDDTQNLIKQLKTSNNNIKAAEEKYRAFIKYAGDTILILDKELKIIDVNNSASRLLGYSGEELLKMKIMDLIPDEEHYSLSEKVNTIKSKGGSLHERKWQRKDGNFIDTEVNVKLLEDVGYISIIRDITEQKKAVLSIKESEEKYRYLFQNSPAYIIIWDLETLKVLEVNDTVVNKYGFSKEEWVNMSVFKYRAPNDHERISAFAQSMLNGNEPVVRMTWTHLKKNGEEMLMEISSHKIIYNNRKAILSLGSDVTEHLKAQSALNKSEEKFHALVDHAAYAIFLVADNGIIFDVNRSATDLLYYSKAELIGKSALELYPQNIRNDIPAVWDTLRKNKSLTDERVLQRKNGTLVEVEISRNMLPDASGAITIVRDITERKRIEAELFEQKEQLALFIEHSPASLAMLDADMRYMTTSRRWIADYHLEGQQIIGKTHYEVFPELPQHWKNIHQRCLQGAVERNEDDAFVRPNGSVEWLRWEIRPWHKVSGEIGGIIMFTEVITKAREAEIKFRSLVEKSMVGVYIVQHGKFLYVNPRFAEIFEYKPEEIIDILATDAVVHESDKELARQNIQAGINGDKNNIHYQFRGRKKNGDQNWVEAFGSRLQFNGDVAIIGSLIDITGRIKAEQEKTEKVLQLTVLTNNLPESIIYQVERELDGRMNFVYISDGIEKYTGKSAAETLVAQHLLYELIHPHYKQKLAEAEEKSFNEMSLFSTEAMVITYSGEERFVKFRSFPRRLENGKVLWDGIITDITERKKAEEALFKSNEQYTLLFNQMLNGLMVCEVIYDENGQPADHRFVQGNPAFEKLTRISMQEELGRTSKDFSIGWPPEITQQLYKVAITGNPIEYERYNETLGKTYSTRVFSPRKGFFAHIFTDITEQKLAEANLRQSEEKHRALIENISDGIVLVDESWNITYQSPSVERIVGFTLEDRKGKTAIDFIHPDDAQICMTQYERARDYPGMPVQSQYRSRHKKGFYIWIEVFLMNLLDNKSIHSYVVIYRDITERKQFEEQQLLMSSIVNSSDDAIISKTLDGTITSWNYGAEKILGYTAPDMIGQNISVIIPLPQFDEENEILESIRMGNAIDHFVTKRIKKNGEIINVSLTVSPIQNSLGQIVGASKILRDITKEKESEERLALQNKELVKTNKELDRFVYSTSHDLRAPLKSLLGLIGIMKRSTGPADKVQQSRLELMNKSILKLDNFIEDILRYSKNTRMEIGNEAINFEGLIKEIREAQKFSEGARELDLQVAISQEVEFNSDKRRINVILNNIISNAIKYQDISKGSSSFVKIQVLCNKQNVTIIVEDNGIGIADKDQEKIFEMFYRATTISTGSGLGMYLVKETLDKLNGKISMQSELNKGTKFVIEIPNQISPLNK